MLHGIKGKALEKKWRGVIKGFQATSLSVEAYTREHHLSKSSLYKWSKRLKMPLKGPSLPLSFVEIKALDGFLEQPPSSEVFSVEVRISKGSGYLKTELSWPKMVDLVKALVVTC